MQAKLLVAWRHGAFGRDSSTWFEKPIELEAEPRVGLIIEDEALRQYSTCAVLSVETDLSADATQLWVRLADIEDRELSSTQRAGLLAAIETAGWEPGVEASAPDQELPTEPRPEGPPR